MVVRRVYVTVQLGCLVVGVETVRPLPRVDGSKLMVCCRWFTLNCLCAVKLCVFCRFFVLSFRSYCCIFLVQVL